MIIVVIKLPNNQVINQIIKLSNNQDIKKFNKLQNYKHYKTSTKKLSSHQKPRFRTLCLKKKIQSYQKLSVKNFVLQSTERVLFTIILDWIRQNLEQRMVDTA